MKRKEFDKKIKKLALTEEFRPPESLDISVDKTLAKLPDKEVKHSGNCLLKICFAIVFAVFIFLFIIPNLSPAYAEALKDVPVIGDIVKVFTIRGAQYSDDYHEIVASVPKVEDKENSSAAEHINKDINELTDRIINEFYKELKEIGDEGHGSVYIDYEVILDTERWFSLKLCVCEAAGSGNIYYRYYHIDRNNGDYVKLSDLFKDSSYQYVLAEEIRRQMRKLMKNDSKKVYWIDGNSIGYDFTKLDADQGYYFDDENNLVIVFDKYEVTPGYMGCPEFKIKREVYGDLLKEKYKNIP